MVVVDSYRMCVYDWAKQMGVLSTYIALIMPNESTKSGRSSYPSIPLVLIGTTE